MRLTDEAQGAVEFGRFRNLAEAHTSLAFVLDLYDWDWESAEREYKRAISLNPGLRDRSSLVRPGI